MSNPRFAALLIGGVLALTSCGDDGAGTTSVEVPDDATFCSVFLDQYQEALDDAVPITDDAFGETTALIAAWAEVLLSLAPAEIVGQAGDNLEYHEAQAAVRSASDFISGSNEMHAWAYTNCG